ncbi:hypothetical protein V6259_13080 [Marinomonas sp. TI.3.20]|uniref:hypothetical protein n=1 Tax=Marinomonas sp. TI.3.20 TaxID=3121296 RepID=UPI00311F1FF0
MPIKYFHSILLAFWLGISGQVFFDGSLVPLIFGLLIGLVLDIITATYSHQRPRSLSFRRWASHAKRFFSIKKSTAYKGDEGAVNSDNFESLCLCISYLVGAATFSYDGVISSGTKAAQSRILALISKSGYGSKSNYGHDNPDEVALQLSYLQEHIHRENSFFALACLNSVLYVSYADGTPNEHQKSIISQIVYVLRVSGPYFEEALREIKSVKQMEIPEWARMLSKMDLSFFQQRAQSEKHSYSYNDNAKEKRQADVNDHSKLADARRLFNANESLGPKELKTIYRRLISIHHPDKAIAKGANESKILESKIMTQRIQDAYEVLKAAC